MLVLSRRLKEKVLFPDLNASVQVLTIKPGVVRLGIEAPPQVGVFREEILDSGNMPKALGPPPSGLGMDLKLGELKHLVANRLNAVNVGMALLRRQIQAGRNAASQSTLEKIDQEFQLLREQVETVVQEVRSTVRPRKACHALVVEDDHNERELLAGFLRMAGLTVATAGDGTDALDYLRDPEEESPDVVLLDMVLPRCDGTAIVRAIRRDPALAKLKIFAMTGHAPERFGLSKEPAGIDRWFNKPLNPENLLRDLNQEFPEEP